MEQKLKPQSVFNDKEEIGVVWVMDEAIKLGYLHGDADWTNFGQGEPELGELTGGTTRVKLFVVEPEDNAYGPVNGLDILRQTIAEHYNRLYRVGKSSQYAAENVSIAMGGRLALTRIFNSMGAFRLGYKIPDYPAYRDMLKLQAGKIIPICVPTFQDNNYTIPPSEFGSAIEKFQLDAFLFSNPCNPTGHVIMDQALYQYVSSARELNCTLIIDEFYSHFIYENGKPANKVVSAAKYLDNVNEDAVIIVDGLTKSFRYPGWRLAWILGPKKSIDIIGKVASGIDGGPSLPIQRAALPLFEPISADLESHVLQKVFSHKQQLMVKALEELGMRCSSDSNSTFYVWADISQLPKPINEASRFFVEALKYKVICVPGYLFDIHPQQLTTPTNFLQHIRFSFGPEESFLKKGLIQLAKLVKSYQ